MRVMKVPFYRVGLEPEEIEAVAEVLRSGWLTTGEVCHRFETQFAAAVGADHAIALNSCTAALHLAVEALGLQRGGAVLVPTMTFAATAEVVRYMGGVPIFVDCDPRTLNLDWDDAERKLAATNASGAKVVGIIPVHVAGLVVDLERLAQFRQQHHIWSVEDAAHAFPAAWRPSAEQPWQTCGSGPSEVTCYSFYANKTITTGEGGMAVTNDPKIAERIRLMSLHGLSNDAWKRFHEGGSWNYKILAPGFKYNLTDIAAALGVRQLQRAEALRADRERLAMQYRQELADLAAVSLPPCNDQNLHSWHIFPIRIQLDQLTINRDQLIEQLGEAGIGTSVHWRPLHLHPYYRETFPDQLNSCPTADAVWRKIITLPLFPSMTGSEQEYVIATLRRTCKDHRR